MPNEIFLEATEDQLLSACIDIGLKELIVKLKNGESYPEQWCEEASHLIFSKIRTVNNKFDNNLHVEIYFAHHLLRKRLELLSKLAQLIFKWEFFVRSFAYKMNIKVNKEGGQKNKKSINMGTISLKDLSEVITELKGKLSSNLNLDLEKFRKYRNAISHCNLQELRVIYNNGNVPDNHKGNVHQITLCTDDILNFSDQNLSEQESNSINVYGWLLDVTSSTLLTDLEKDFEFKIKLINGLIFVKALSYDKAKGFFEKIAVEGKILSEAEKEIFLNNTTSKEERSLRTEFLSIVHKALKVP